MTGMVRMALYDSLLGRAIPPGNRWVVELTADSFADHKLQDMVVFPGSVYLDLALTAATVTIGVRPSVLEDVSFDHALVLSPDAPRELQIELIPGQDNRWEFTATGAATDVQHAAALIPTQSAQDDPLLDLADPLWQQGTEISGEALYAQMASAGNYFGPRFRSIQRCRVGDGRVVATWQSPTTPSLTTVDTAMQALTAATGVSDRTFALVGLERLRLTDTPTSPQIGKVYAKLRPGWRADSDEVTGDAVLLDDEGQLIVELTGMRLRCLDSSHSASEALQVAVAATFTAEPLEDSLEFWFDALGISADIKFAGYNQVFQQLLDPGSLLSTNTEGLNVVLVRPEDLLRGGPQDIAELVPYETEYLYKEIFERQVYLRHGIELPDDPCVFDVGANIGMFTMFVRSRCPNARVYAFEPAPATFDILLRNCPDAMLFNYGLADKNSVQDFTFYPNSPAYSGFAANETRDRRAVEAVVRNMLRRNMPAESPDFDPLVAQFTADRLAGETHRVETRTLSSVLTEHSIERVDLLKIDAEGSEVGILAGIRDEHWQLIRQVVAEVHTPEDGIRVAEMLSDRGFTVHVDDQDELLMGTGFVNVYARNTSSWPQNHNNLSIGTSPNARFEGTPGPATTLGKELAGAFEAFRQRVEGPCIFVLCPPVDDALVQVVTDLPDVVVITPDELQRYYAVSDYVDVRTERLGRIPYTNRFFAALGTMITRRYLTTRQPPAKVLVLDCDQTLWTGVCGEDGPHGVHIDPYRQELQEFVVRQHDLGVLICLCSKNNPADVLDVFAQRTDMPLQLDHIAAHRLNWQHKSANLVSLAEELGLSLSDFVFLDDNPVECAEVQANLPEVLTLRIPDTTSEIPRFLDHIWTLDRARLTDEDRARNERYRQEQQRQAARAESITFESFLASLDLQVDIQPWKPSDLPRVAQLTERTNQFTTTGARQTEAQLNEALTSGSFDCFTVRVQDRFGDYGLVGATLFRPTETALQVNSFFLSCRALSRGVEDQMVTALGEIARNHDRDRIEIVFVPTGRNEPARAYFETVSSSSYSEGEEFRFILTGNASIAFGGSIDRSREVKTETTTNTVQRKLPTGRGFVSNSRNSDIPYTRIVEELRDLDAIVAAIDAGRIRSRPVRQAAPTRPNDEIERKLVDLWQHVLGVDEVGVDDNFFDLGGTSLRAVQVMAELSELTGRRMPPISTFENNTIRSIAAMLRTDSGGSDDSTEHAERGTQHRRDA